MLDECLLFEKQIQHGQVCLAQARWFDICLHGSSRKIHVVSKETVENMVFPGEKKKLRLYF